MPFTGLYVTFRGLHFISSTRYMYGTEFSGCNSSTIISKKSSRLSVFLIVPHSSCLIDVLFFLLVIHFYIHSLCMHTSIHSCIFHSVARFCVHLFCYLLYMFIVYKFQLCLHRICYITWQGPKLTFFSSCQLATEILFQS